MAAAADHRGASSSGLIESCRRAAALLAIVARIDARRPASWIALAAAAAAVVVLSGTDATAPVARAIACGGLAAIAAVGSLAVAAAPPAGVRAWWAARSAWPVLGAIAGGAAVGDWLAAATVAGAALLTTLAHAVATRCGAAAAGAAGVAVALAAAAAAAATFGVDPATAAGSGVAGWLVPACVALAVCGRRAADPLASFAAPVHGIGGSTLERLAMASTLAAMVGCYFLTAEHAAWYVAIACGWFMALAVPAATIAAGAGDAPSRRLLVRSAAGAPRLPGTLPYAVGAIAIHTAILGWPAAVAALVLGPAALEPGGPLVAVLVLTLLAAATAALLWIASACRATGDTTLALIAAGLAAIVSAAWPV